MRSTAPRPGGVVPLTWARANLGSLIRWTHTTAERTTITERRGASAVLISAQELADLERMAAVRGTGPRASNRPYACRWPRPGRHQ